MSEEAHQVMLNDAIEMQRTHNERREKKRINRSTKKIGALCA